MAVAPYLHASRLCIVCFLFRLHSLFPLRALTSIKHHFAELAKMAILPEISGQRNGPPLNGQWLFFCFVLFLFFCFDICMEVHYQFELAKSATFLDHQNSAV